MTNAHGQMRGCDQQLERYMAELPGRVVEDGSAPAGQKKAAGGKKRGRAKSKSRGNAPEWDLQPELQRITGVDLTTIDGIDVMTAQTILAEIGPDMSAFPSEDHFASWLGLTPNKRITGGKVVGRERRKASAAKCATGWPRRCAWRRAR